MEHIQTRPTKVRVSKLERGQRVRVGGRVLLVTDQRHTDYTAWENYPFDVVMLVDTTTGETVTVHGQADPTIYLEP